MKLLLTSPMRARNWVGALSVPSAAQTDSGSWFMPSKLPEMSAHPPCRLTQARLVTAKVAQSPHSG